jgi:hypothetical protein
MELDKTIVQKVWEMGRASLERDGGEWREDECGAWMQRDQFNNANSEFGWHIRNIQAGDDSPENLRPFHIENEYNLMAQTPRCQVTADRSHIPPTSVVGKPRNKSI